MTKNTPVSQSCCQPGCCSGLSGNEQNERELTIDFLYLDLNVCTWCQGTDSSLDAALADVTKVLEVTGVKVKVNKIHVTTEEQAIQYRFSSSPTIRINDRDIQLETKEALCASCGDLCGDEVDCRVWLYQGKEYTVPPKAMIVEAILRQVYGGEVGAAPSGEYVLPENLKKFFSSMKKKLDNKQPNTSESKVWYPSINYENCISCGACFNKCPNGVYQLDDGRPIVVNPNGCVLGCRGCQKLCPVDAIQYVGDTGAEIQCGCSCGSSCGC